MRRTIFARLLMFKFPRQIVVGQLVTRRVRARKMRKGSERYVKITKFEYFAVRVHGKLQTTASVLPVHTRELTRQS